METIAVYWESKIRTYGFTVQEGLFLVRLTLAGEPPMPGQDPSALIEMLDMPFQWVWARTSQTGRMAIFLLCTAEHQAHVERFSLPAQAQSGFLTAETLSKVDLVYFQGPHFGDRFGIADYVLRALAGDQVPLIAATCSGSVMGLVLPAGWGRKTDAILSQAFEIPSGHRRRQPGQDPPRSGTHL